MSRGSFEDVGLRRWREGEFVPAPDALGSHYGVFQQWMAEPQLGNRKLGPMATGQSCAMAAAVNTAAYLSAKKETAGLLATDDTPSADKLALTRLMREFFDRFSPKPWGVPLASLVARPFVKWAAERGVFLRARQLEQPLVKGQKAKEVAMRFIEKGLSLDTPVLMVNWLTYTPELRWHWVTITRAYYEEGENYITVSNWGQQRTYSFDKLYQNRTSYRAFVYFQ